MGLPLEDPVQPLLYHGLEEAEEVGAGRHPEEDVRFADLKGIRTRDGEDGLPLHRQHDRAGQKGGGLVGFDGHKQINGTKIHVVVTEQSFPVAVTIGSGREHEGRRLIPLLESISITHGRGRPKKRPGTLYADTKYGIPLNRFYLDGKHIRSQIPESPNKKRRPGRPRTFDEPVYHRIRSSTERFNAWIKAFRRVAIRYERLSTIYMGFVYLACIVIYLRNLQ